MKRKRKTTRISAWPFSSGEDGSYRTAQVSHGDGRRKKRKTEEDGSYQTEDERRARLEYLSDNPIYIPNNLYLILNVAF